MRSIFALSLILTLISCSSKPAPKAVSSLAANRKMGITIKIDGAASEVAANEAKGFFSQATLSALEKTYGSKALDLKLQFSHPLETPENLYEIGRTETDDIFLIEVKVPSKFISPTSPNPAAILGAPESLHVKASILNGANLRTVNVFSFTIPSQPLNQIDPLFQGSFAKESLKVFSNPNIYPKNVTKYYADLLYVFSEQHEKNFKDSLSCANAPQRYMYYKWASELYEIALKKGASPIVGSQSETHTMTSRQIEASAKSKILDDCLLDERKGFEMNIEYGPMTAENKVFIQKSIDELNLMELLKQYTDKPVKLRFSLDQNGILILDVDLRFDQRKYLAWTINRIPSRIRDFQILSLDPYYALMQKLVVLRASLPSDAPLALRSAFASMRMSLHLQTLLSGQVSFGVDGRYITETKVVRMAYPSQIMIASPGSETRTITNKDQGIFQERGWIALSNCKTLDGSKTEDGLVYDFFGFKCQ